MVKNILRSRGNLSRAERSRKFWDSFMYWCFSLCGLSAIAAVCGIAAYMVLAGTPAINEIGLFHFLLGSRWEPTAPQPAFGVLPMILTSVAGTALSVLASVLVGTLTAVFLEELAPNRLRQAAQATAALMAGLPSVVYGLVGATLLVPLVGKAENALFRGSSSHIFTGGANLLSASILLTVMILPTAIQVGGISLRAVPRELREASLALGADRTETAFKVLIPAARPGIVTGAVLGTGRAMGEAMAVMMVSGNAVNFPLPFHSVRFLTTGIVTEMGYSSGLHRKALFSIGLALFVWILATDLILEALVQREGGGQSA